MKVLTHAWRDSGGSVIGLAPSAVAAQELSAAINSGSGDQRTCSRSPQATSSPAQDGPRRHPGELVWHAEHGGAPAWMDRIDASTLVLIDEAGMAATTDLAPRSTTSPPAADRSADRRRPAAGLGRRRRNPARHRPPVGAVTLSEVHRFRNPDGSPNHAEAAATLALRDGDPSAIAFYTDRGRIHVGDLGTCADQAYAAWAADRPPAPTPS